MSQHSQSKLMRNYLLKLTPFAEIDPDHPVFRYEVSRLRCARTQAKFEQYSLLWLGIGVVTGICLLGAACSLTRAASADALHDPLSIAVLCAFMLMASIALGFTLDYAASAAGLSAAIRRDLLGDRWTLLRVTPLREGGLILAKYAAAQCRGWWPVMVMIGLRTGLAAVWFVMLLIAGSLSPIAILTPILVIGFLIVEPVARLRSFSALGTYVSAQVTDGLGGHLLMAAYLGAFWFAQSIVLLSLILITAPFIFFLALSADPTLSLLWLVYIPLIAVMSTGLALTIRAWALRATVRSVKSYHERS